MSQRVGEETARSEQLESALSEYLRPTDLEDAEERENEDPNMYYETLSGKSVVEENIEKNVKSSKTSHKEVMSDQSGARSAIGSVPERLISPKKGEERERSSGEWSMANFSEWATRIADKLDVALSRNEELSEARKRDAVLIARLEAEAAETARLQAVLEAEREERQKFEQLEVERQRAERIARLQRASEVKERAEADAARAAQQAGVDARSASTHDPQARRGLYGLPPPASDPLRDRVNVDVTVPRTHVTVETRSSDSIDKARLTMPKLVVTAAVQSVDNSEALRQWNSKAAWAFQAAWLGGKMVWVKSLAVADEAHLEWTAAAPENKSSVTIMSPEFTRAEQECESKFLPIVIKSLPHNFVRIIEIKENNPDFGLPMVLFELAKRLRIFTTKGGISLVESLEKVNTGMKNSQLTLFLAEYQVKWQQLEDEGQFSWLRIILRKTSLQLRS